MTKKKAAIISVCIVCTAISAFGAWRVPLLIREAEAAKRISEAQAAQPELTRVAQAVNASDLDTRNKTRQIVQYADWVKVYQPTQAQQDEISRMIAGGADVDVLMDICRFWEDTNEPFSLVAELYAQCPEAELLEEFTDNMLWITGAYDHLRGKEDEALTVEDIMAYQEQGVTLEDVRIADRMSRSGADIRDVLERKIAGETWQQLILPDYEQTAPLAEATQPLQPSGNDLLDSVILSRKSGRPVSEFLEMAREDYSVMEAYRMEQTASTLDELTAIGLVGEEAQK